MPAAKLIKDLNAGAGKFYLAEPIKSYDYVIVAPEPEVGYTTIYPTTHQGTAMDITDENNNPVVLKRFPQVLSSKEALHRLGYEVV